jgi:hypothetical protein
MLQPELLCGGPRRICAALLGRRGGGDGSRGVVDRGGSRCTGGQGSLLGRRGGRRRGDLRRSRSRGGSAGRSRALVAAPGGGGRRRRLLLRLLLLLLLGGRRTRGGLGHVHGRLHRRGMSSGMSSGMSRRVRARVPSRMLSRVLSRVRGGVTSGVAWGGVRGGVAGGVSLLLLSLVLARMLARMLRRVLRPLRVAAVRREVHPLIGAAVHILLVLVRRRASRQATSVSEEQRCQRVFSRHGHDRLGPFAWEEGPPCNPRGRRLRPRIRDGRRIERKGPDATRRVNDGRDGPWPLQKAM